MLTAEGNERLTRIGPGTPMGGLMRLYWPPFYPGGALPAAEQPKRVKNSRRGSRCLSRLRRPARTDRKCLRASRRPTYVLTK